MDLNPNKERKERVRDKKEVAFEKFQSMTEEHLKKCPKCKKDALKRKIGTGAGIIFKGAGFYCNDYHAATNEVKSK